MKNKIAKYIISASALFPAFASAQQQLGQTLGLAQQIFRIINILIPIAFTLALLYFFWGVAQYILQEGQGKEEGRKIMVWGVVALFVMSSVWGLVRFIQIEFNIQNNINMPIPMIQGGGSGGQAGIDLNV